MVVVGGMAERRCGGSAARSQLLEDGGCVVVAVAVFRA